MIEKTMLTQSDLSARGWTKGMVSRLLPEPTLGKNKYCRNRPMKLWELHMIEEVEKTEAYTDELKKVQNHRHGGIKAAATKRAALQNDFEKIQAEINVPCVDDATLRKWVYQNMRNRNIQRGLWNSYPEDAPEETMQRWVVNFIRHNLVSYDYTLHVHKGRVGINECYTDYKKAILMKIAEVYPQYADECKRQMI